MVDTTGVTGLEEALVARIGELSVAETGSADPQMLWRIFDAQVASRHLDAVARELQAAGRGFYTISSAGHESNAIVAEALRVDDPALLHYRSGAFYVSRARRVASVDPVRDVLQSLMCSVDEPIAGGRHKVFGHVDLAVIPQTSTIASHLPRAFGLALSLHRAARVGVPPRWPVDAVVMCSFGDASANHSTATGAVNAALNAAFRGLPVPLLLVCEDNGLGISVPTPARWIENAYGARPGLAYLVADGSDPVATLDTAVEAVRLARTERKPVFLHLKTVRYLGHAGSDAEIGYRTPVQIASDQAKDPILGTARALAGAGATPDEILARYRQVRRHIDGVAASLGDVQTLGSPAQVMAPLSPRSPDRVATAAAALRVDRPPAAVTLAESINATLADALERDPRVVVFGEDVGRKGGVYGVTRGLARRFGAARVFDTVLDEQTIFGVALGAGLAGLVPVPEIQYLAYLHNAEDQLRGEAASLSFFSTGQYRNPLVVRIAGLAYQRGFGGHFHNDNGVAVLRDIPGVVVACPSRGDDAAAMLRTCLAAAAVDGTVCVFLEPIALYHTRDLHSAGDGLWQAPDTGDHVPIGRARTHLDGVELTIVTFGNGVPMSLRAARQLARREVDPVRVRVVDVRWLAPLPIEDIVREARATGRVLVVDETRRSGGVGEGIITALVEAGYTGRLARVSSEDTFVPLGPATEHVLLSETDIEAAAIELMGRESRGARAERSTGMMKERAS